MTESARQSLQVSLWSAIRLAHGLLPVVSMLKRGGVDADRMLEQARIDRFGLMDPSYTIDIEQELAFLKAAIRALPGPGMSLAMAREYRLRGFSVLGLAMQCAATPLDMLRLIIRYPRLAWGLFEGELIIDGDCMRVCFHPQPRLGSEQGFLLERDIACALVLFEEATESEFPVQAMRFRHTCPGEPEIYKRFFHCPVEFGAERNELVCSAAAVLQPLPHAEPAMCAFYTAQCERMSQDMEQPFSYGEAVRNRLLGSDVLPDLNALAKTMYMTPRTLQRRLKAEGVAFSELLLAVRKQRARQLLAESGQSMEQIAQSLGFSDAVAFSHAFKSWEGSSPRHWRHTVQHQPMG